MVWRVLPRPWVESEGGWKEETTHTHHLVCEDPVQTVVVQRHHPVEALELVRAHLSIDDFWHVSAPEREK